MVDAMTPNTITTRTGITIGGAYTPPSPQPSADAERIQLALLRPSHAKGPLVALLEAAHEHRTRAVRARQHAAIEACWLDNSLRARFVRWCRRLVARFNPRRTI
jgi:hypothetical protein